MSKIKAHPQYNPITSSEIITSSGARLKREFDSDTPNRDAIEKHMRWIQDELGNLTVILKHHDLNKERHERRTDN